MLFSEWKSSHLYGYLVTVREPYEDYVHDGDTFTTLLDLGTDEFNHRFVVRPIGYNAPEINKPETKVAAEASRQFLIVLFTHLKTRDGQAQLAIETKVVGDHEQRSAERYLAIVWVPQDDGSLKNLSDIMIEAGQAIPYKKSTEKES